jgi:hypothetical protein
VSSGSYKRHDSFNPVQIKNGVIVRLGKDGRIREVIDPTKKGKNESKR